MTATTAASVERLRSTGEITEVLRHGRRRGGTVLTLHVRESRHGVARVAVTASRRVGTAVARNRAKRLLREASRSVSWDGGIDVVIVARPTCATARLAEVTAELARVGEGLGVVRSGQ